MNEKLFLVFHKEQHKMCRFRFCCVRCSCWTLCSLPRNERCLLSDKTTADGGEGDKWKRENLFSTLSSSAFHYDIYCSLLLSLLLQFILVISWHKIKEKLMKQQQRFGQAERRRENEGNILWWLLLLKICVCAYLAAETYPRLDNNWKVNKNVQVECLEGGKWNAVLPFQCHPRMYTKVFLLFSLLGALSLLLLSKIIYVWVEV